MTEPENKTPNANVNPSAADKTTESKSQPQAAKKDWLLDNQIPKSHFPEPDWVRRLRLEWCQAVQRTVTWRSEGDLRGNTGEQGAEVGSWLAIYLTLREQHWNELSDEQRQFAQAEFEHTKRLASEFFEVPRWQAAAFFRRFARALEAECFDPDGLPAGGAGDDLTWPIKRVMMREWKTVEKLCNIPELCDFLLNHLPPGTAKGIQQSDQLSAAFHERVKKICQRCGLSLTRPGRPPQ